MQANDHSRYEPVIPVNKTYECGPYSNELEFSAMGIKDQTEVRKLQVHIAKATSKVAGGVNKMILL